MNKQSTLNMSPEQKRKLVQQYKAANSPRIAKPATYGPTSGISLVAKLTPQLTGEFTKRLSFWGGPATAIASNSSDSISAPDTEQKKADSMEKPPEDLQPIQPQTTGGLWSTWWSASAGSTEKASKRTSKELDRSPQAYVDEMKSLRTKDLKLTKSLIALRVQLATAKILWLQDFVGPCRGLVALDTILGALVGKGGKRKAFVEYESENLLEIVKCFRVLMNEPVRVFND